MLADYIYDGILSLHNLAREKLSNIATLNIYAIKKLNKYMF